jgi:putative phosphoesterase
VERLRGADLILHAGDLVSAAFLDELLSLGLPVQAIQGNMDDAVLRATLPGERVVDAGGARIGMLHDAGPAPGREARLAARFPDCAAVVYAHTHLPQVERFQHLWILNPGSPTERRRAPFHSMLELQIDDSEITPELVRLST